MDYLSLSCALIWDIWHNVYVLVRGKGGGVCATEVWWIVHRLQRLAFIKREGRHHARVIALFIHYYFRSYISHRENNGGCQWVHVCDAAPLPICLLYACAEPLPPANINFEVNRATINKSKSQIQKHAYRICCFSGCSIYYSTQIH